MRRRDFVLGSAIAAALACDVAAQTVFRTLVQVSTNDRERLNRILSVVKELGRYHIAYREEAEIRVIAVGDGVNLFLSDRSPVLPRLRLTARSVPIITWQASQEDLDDIAAVEGAAPALEPFVQVIPDGRAETQQLVNDGWSFLDP